MHASHWIAKAFIIHATTQGHANRHQSCSTSTLNSLPLPSVTFRVFEKTSAHVRDHATGTKCDTTTDKLANGWMDRQAYKDKNN